MNDKNNELASDRDLTSVLINAINKEKVYDPKNTIMSRISSGTKLLTDFVSFRITAVRGYFDQILPKN